MKSYGFSLIGKYHINKNTPCQDFNLVIQHADGILAVIADGVSTSEYSDVASKLASETFIKFAQDSIKENMDAETVVSILKQAFTVSLQAIVDHTQQQGHRKSQYDTTLTGLFFTKSFVCIGHSGDGGVIGLKPSGLYVSLTEKLDEVEDGTRYVTPLAKPQHWKFYSYQESFARILMATDGVYDTFYSHLLQDQKDPLNIQMIERFMNSKGLNQSLTRLEVYKSKFVESLINAKLTDDDMTCVLLIDDSITLERQPEAYYQIPDWDKLQEEFRKKLYPQTDPEIIIKEESKEILEEEVLEKVPIFENKIESNSDLNSEKTDDSDFSYEQQTFSHQINLHSSFNKSNNHSIEKRKIKNKILSFLYKNYIFDLQKKPIQYNSNPLFESSQLQIFPLKEDKDKVVYLYPLLTENDEKKLLKFKERSLSYPLISWMPWPQNLVYDKNGKCVGFITKALQHYTYLFSFLNFSQTHQEILNVISSSLVLAKNLCVITSFIHNEHWVIRRFDPKQFFVDLKKGYIFLIDILNIDLNETSALLINSKNSNLEYLTPFQINSLDLHGNMNFTTSIDVDLSSNSFSLSVIIFQLLMRGYHPYSFVEKSIFINDKKEFPIAEALKAGISYFFVQDVKYAANPKAPSLTILPKEIHDSFLHVFSLKTITNSSLFSAKTWYKYLEKYGSYKL